ncbi:hypothetical protein EMIT0P12_40345 [Pseudomonas sp. IT-P12]
MVAEAVQSCMTGHREPTGRRKPDPINFQGVLSSVEYCGGFFWYPEKLARLFSFHRGKRPGTAAFRQQRKVLLPPV